MPLAEITNDCVTKVSVHTVRGARHEQGWWSRVAAKKRPSLANLHKARRLNFAKFHRTWTVEERKQVWWTNESKSEIGRNKLVTQVWRTRSERYASECLSPTGKSGRILVMVWGASVNDRKSKLIVMAPGKRKRRRFRRASLWAGIDRNLSAYTHGNSYGGWSSDWSLQCCKQRHESHNIEKL